MCEPKRYFNRFDGFIIEIKQPQMGIFMVLDQEGIELCLFIVPIVVGFALVFGGFETNWEGFKFGYIIVPL